MNLNFFRNPNFQVALFVIFFVIGGIYAVISYIKLDENLKDTEKFQQIQAQLENEFKQIALPPKTAVNSFKNTSKQDVWANLETRYRTEIDSLEFYKHINNELEKRGWIRYDANKFCKEGFNAELVSDDLFSQDRSGNYYILILSFGKREYLGEVTLPKECYKIG